MVGGEPARFADDSFGRPQAVVENGCLHLSHGKDLSRPDRLV
jgi:hypothetical protein